MRTARRKGRTGGRVAGLLLSAIPALAQPYTVESFTADGGGGTSSGGAYSVSGTFGQPDAGIMSGGNFTLVGGFWPGVALDILDGPILAIQALGTDVQLSWTPSLPGFVLETADRPLGSPWTGAPSGNPVTIVPAGAAKFYRLRKP